MSSVRKQTNGAGIDFLLLLVLMPLVSAVLLLAGSGQSSQATEIESPPVVIQQQPANTATPAVQSQQQNSAQPAATGVAAADVPDTNAEFLALYGEKIYPTLQSMPADMLTWYLTWVHRVAVAYDVPDEDILTVHFAELMGIGFNPLETRRSRSRAAGPGQIIPQTWNGWSCGARQSVFMTDPAQIEACGGLGTDFDGDGVANVDNLPDNLAATARHIKNDGIATSLRADEIQHESMLREALSSYNSGTGYWQATALTRTYADIGVTWWRENGALVAVYLSVYAPNA